MGKQPDNATMKNHSRLQIFAAAMVRDRVVAPDGPNNNGHKSWLCSEMPIMVAVQFLLP